MRFFFSIILIVVSSLRLGAQGRQEVYCFNQRYIASEGGKYGMLDNRKKEILPLVYDGITFITDDIALLYRYGSYMLSDKWGRIFAEGSSRQELEQSCQDLYDKVLEDDRQYWETVLAAYSDFSAMCSQVRGHRGAEEKLLPLRRKIENLLKMKRGFMDEDQVARFRQITSTYGMSGNKEIGDDKQNES